MRPKLLACLLILVACGQAVAQERRVFEGAEIILPSAKLKSTRALRLHRLFYGVGNARIYPTRQQFSTSGVPAGGWTRTVEMPDGQKITASITRDRDNFDISFKAQPDTAIGKWGISIDALPGEYFTGLMERVVDGPQAKSWAPGITEAMDLRGQKVDMIIKPTTSVYAPFYISSRGYAVFVKGNWPGVFDLAASNKQSVQIEFEGPSLELKIYTASDPASLVRQHALDAGPPFLPPKWIYTP